MQCTIVDVFAESPLSGNQLAVMRDVGELSTDQMQALALEMNFSETTFVFDERADRARVRIFTPDRELPFAGHPTLGTAWVLAGNGAHITLELAAGDVDVEFDGNGIGWMTPPKTVLGDGVEAARAAALLQLSTSDLHEEFSARRAVVGPSFVLVGVSSLDALRRVRVDETVSNEISGGDFMATFVFAPESYSPDADFAARMFFAAQGAREDPATGSANTAFAAYLREMGHTGDVIVEQGFEIGRPSRLYLDIGPQIRVGGRVQPVLEGTIEAAMSNT